MDLVDKGVALSALLFFTLNQRVHVSLACNVYDAPAVSFDLQTNLILC